MLSWKDFMIAMIRYEEMKGEADEFRLVRETNKSKQHLHRKLLAWLGQRLVTWGLSLQERYKQQTTPFNNQTMDIG